MYELLVGLGFILERVIELLISPIYDNVVFLDKYRWTLKYWAIALGVLASFQFQLDLVSGMLSIDPTPTGTVLTGVLLGGGSELLHQVLGKLQVKE